MTRNFALVAFALSALSAGCNSSTTEYLVTSDISSVTRGVDTLVVATFEDDVIPTTPNPDVRLFLVDEVGADADLSNAQDLGRAEVGTTPTGMVTSFEVVDTRTIQFGIRLDEALDLSAVDVMLDLSPISDPHSGDRAFGVLTLNVE